MKILVQRVLSASVAVNREKIAQIDQGALLFVGFGRQDSKEILLKAAQKVIELRYFADEQDKMNLSIQEIKGSFLVVSQFTLYASCERGRRPDFFAAMEPKLANDLFKEFVSLLSLQVPVKTGVFGANMEIELINDGPVTLMNLSYKRRSGILVVS